ncbi:MAG: hypothetical protein ACT6WE_15090, partial [Shinella sp.]
FLEGVHPSIRKTATNVWTNTTRNGRPTGIRRLKWPALRLHCQTCSGERTFRSSNLTSVQSDQEKVNAHPEFTCGDCKEETKIFSLHIVLEKSYSGQVYKYGEIPPFGIPVANRVIRLFGGTDAKLFLKGRQCENLGYGIAAYAYYRRVVENHKNDLFKEIIKVCETVNADGNIIVELKAAMDEISFSKSLDLIKTALPQGLLINGHNPLSALHGALSIGLHSESDEDCLAAAAAVRLVLTDLVEKIALLKQDNRELNSAVQLLLSKRA